MLAHLELPSTKSWELQRSHRPRSGRCFSGTRCSGFSSKDWVARVTAGREFTDRIALHVY